MFEQAVHAVITWLLSLKKNTALRWCYGLQMAFQAIVNNNKY